MSNKWWLSIMVGSSLLAAPFLQANTQLKTKELITPNELKPQEFRFTYSKLYSQLKYNQKPEYHDIALRLSFIESKTKQTCRITKAWMEKENHYEQFSIAADQTLPLPIDDNLKSANPLVYVQVVPQTLSKSNSPDLHCNYAWIISTKSALTGKVSTSQFESIVTQMQGMISELSGPLARWFSPKVQGLTLVFPQQITGNIKVIGNQIIHTKPIIDHRVQLTRTDVQQGQYIQLPATTYQVLPYIKAQTD